MKQEEILILQKRKAAVLDAGHPGVSEPRIQYLSSRSSCLATVFVLPKARVSEGLAVAS